MNDLFIQLNDHWIEVTLQQKALIEDTSCGLLCGVYMNYPCMHLFSPESRSANTQATSVQK